MGEAMMDKNQICELAIEFFTESLAERQTTVSPARWLKENHDFLQDFLHPPFELAGYAPAEWDALVLFAAGHGVSGGELVDVGLALERPNNPGHYYDRFRNRIMISVRHKGVVVEFGGYSVTNAPPKLVIVVPRHIKADPVFYQDVQAMMGRMGVEALARLIDQMVVEKKGES
jgi:hypothetical protein